MPLPSSARCASGTRCSPGTSDAALDWLPCYGHTSSSPYQQPRHERRDVVRQEAAARESEVLTEANYMYALGEMQHALGEAGQEVARLRYKQDIMRRALKDAGAPPSATPR